MITSQTTSTPRAQPHLYISTLHVSLHPTALTSPTPPFSPKKKNTHLYPHPHCHLSVHFLCFFFKSIVSWKSRNLTMLLRTAASAASASSLSLFSPTSEPLRSVPARGLVVRAAKGSTNHRALTGVIFEPFEEVKKELDLVPTVPQASLARQKYVDESEAAVNEQIKLLLSLSLSLAHRFYFIFLFFSI